jgi:hypothetical protein
MIKYIVIGLLILTLLSCGEGGPPKEIVQEDSELRIELRILGEKALQREYQEFIKENTNLDDNSVNKVEGFSAKYKGEGLCVVFVLDPNIKESKHTIETLGHELAHCFFGQWHGADGKLPKKFKMEI